MEQSPNEVKSSEPTVRYEKRTDMPKLPENCEAKKSSSEVQLKAHHDCLQEPDISFRLQSAIISLQRSTNRQKPFSGAMNKEHLMQRQAIRRRSTNLSDMVTASELSSLSETSS